MRTIPITRPDGFFSFGYFDGRKLRVIGGNTAPRTWPTAAQRDAARSCFTRRRSVQAAFADLALLDGKDKA